MTASRVKGGVQVIKGALPDAHPLGISVLITKEATPNSYGFDVSVDKPFQLIYFDLPHGLQLLGATPPAGLPCGSQAQSDGTGRVACQHIGPGSAPAGSVKFTLTFSGPLPSPVTYGGFGVAPLSSMTGQALVH